MMKLTLGFSPCPNDTFIFDALVNKRIDTGDLEFEAVMHDVQTLNEGAIKAKLDVTKISYGVLPLVLKYYALLNAGGALGKGVGPLLISKKPLSLSEIPDVIVGIPGENTTAHLLFCLAFPAARKKQFMIFSDIEHSIVNGTVDAGVIIHENRFTYQDKGLSKLMDLGEYWEKQTGSPIPLGGIIMRKNFNPALHVRVNSLIRKSTQYALDHYPIISGFVKQHSQEMAERVMRQHIDLYVNNYSLSLGKEGKAAVKRLLHVYKNVTKSTGQIK